MLKEKGFHSSLVLNFSLILTLKEILIIQTNCPGGGIGRHKGLKIPRRQLRAGSSPAPGTSLYNTNIYYVFLLVILYIWISKTKIVFMKAQ